MKNVIKLFIAPFQTGKSAQPRASMCRKKKKVFFFLFGPVKTLSPDFLIHLICINNVGWHQQFNHLINLDLSIYVDQHKLRHLENGLRAVGSMRWTGSKCVFRTAAAHIESEACSYSTLHKSKATEEGLLYFLSPDSNTALIHFRFRLMKYPLHYNTVYFFFFSFCQPIVQSFFLTKWNCQNP